MVCRKLRFQNFDADMGNCTSPLAQLVERGTVNLEAIGSTPIWRVDFE